MMAANWEIPQDESSVPDQEQWRTRPYDPRQGDALQTLMEWLYGQMEKTSRGARSSKWPFKTFPA